MNSFSQSVVATNIRLFLNVKCRLSHRCDTVVQLRCSWLLFTTCYQGYSCDCIQLSPKGRKTVMDIKLNVCTKMQSIKVYIQHYPKQNAITITQFIFITISIHCLTGSFINPILRSFLTISGVHVIVINILTGANTL